MTMAPTGMRDRPVALAELKAALENGRAALARQHADGASGAQVAAALNALCNDIVTAAYQRALSEAEPEARPQIADGLALIAVGGFGRGDLAPYSDVDLLFLAGSVTSRAVTDFVSRLVRDCWDVGLKLSQSVRTVADAAAAARADLTLRTALAEARLLVGSAALHAQLQPLVRELLRSVGMNRFLAEMLTERTKEHSDYHAQTVLLLEPNVKKSPGGLRDFHLLRWVALARHGTADLAALQAADVLSAADAASLVQVVEFLQRIRQELHFYAGSAQDVLTREEQMRLAQWLEFKDEGPLLGVELFMRHYYRQTAELHDVVMRFVERHRRRPLWLRVVGRLTRRQSAPHILLDRREVALDPAAPPEVVSDGATLLRLFDLARRQRVAVARETFERIRDAVPHVQVDAALRRQFLALLSEPAGLGELLRHLHRVGLLSRLLPAFEHARGLIQFNMYHKYTVDEHLLRAVEAAARRATSRTPLGEAYRAIRRTDLLHLALLLHDLGKGLGEDHSEVGRTLAEEAARDFDLPEHDRRLLMFVVHKHLLMAHTAFRRDMHDEQTLVGFARTVATPELLRMLYVLTAADVEAVAPESWTAWKESLLNELYFRTLEELAGDTAAADEQTRVAELRRELQTQLARDFPPQWLQVQLDAMPASYLRAAEPARLAEHLQVLRTLPPGGVRVATHYEPAHGFSEYAIFTWDDLTPGIFSKIAGALAVSGVQIVSAQIWTRGDGLVLDVFRGADLTFDGAPPAQRQHEVAQRIEEVLLGKASVEALLARRGLLSLSRKSATPLPPQVEIDTESSDRYTIIDVFAEDRLGRLYTITRTLFELGLSIHAARISTHGDQIVDAFYVSEQKGQKVTDPAQLAAIQQRLLEALTRV